MALTKHQEQLADAIVGETEFNTDSLTSGLETLDAQLGLSVNPLTRKNAPLNATFRKRAAALVSAHVTRQVLNRLVELVTERMIDKYEKSRARRKR